MSGRGVAALAGDALFDRAVCALNGVIGDRLQREGNPLGLPMGLVFAGAPLAARREALAAAYPQATGRIAIFVHGLSCDERMWARGAEETWQKPGVSYGSLLEEGMGYTPLYLRYNTGLRLAENGRALARLLGEVLEAWPVAPERVVLIGHSMGGLIARGACHHGLLSGASWVERVSDVFCLGSPHEGAPLEKLGAAAVALLGLLDVTEPFARAIEVRSAGIKDLRDAAAVGDASGVPALSLDRARYHFVGASLGPPAVGWAVGDGMVRLGSATARKAPQVETTVIPGVNHLAMMNHPAVWAVIERALGA